jgi:hypothetical protein
MSIDELYSDYKRIGNSSSMQRVNFQELFGIANLLIEKITFSDAYELKSFLNKQTEDELYYMPFWVKALIFRLVILQLPDDIETLEWAINHLSWFVDSNSDFILEMKSQLSKLKMR